MSILQSFKITQQDNIIAAVSGGPDSMALLDMLVKEGFKPVICHVNYHKRETSNRDEEIVRRYASKYNLTVKVLHATDETSGNFQNWAREFRYNFFKLSPIKHYLHSKVCFDISSKIFASLRMFYV